MPKVMEYNFVTVQPPSAATAERMLRFLADALAKHHGKTVSGTFRVLPPEEVGKRPLIDTTTLKARREAS